MKFGIKTWSTNTSIIKLCPNAYKHREFDFIEITAIINTFDENILKQIKHIPTIIHCDNTDVDFSDMNCEKNNILAIEEAIKFANYLDSKYIIVHPGYTDSIENLNNFLAKYKDSRICVENMPGKTVDLKRECIGKNVLDFEKINFNNFCLDFAHAIKAAKTLKLPEFTIIDDFYRNYSPVVYHISDGFSDSEIDEHLNIGEGNFDFLKITSYIKPDTWITLETPKSDYESIKDDIENVKKIKKFFV